MDWGHQSLGGLESMGLLEVCRGQGQKDKKMPGKKMNFASLELRDCR